MPLFHNKKLVFIHIPKSGGTSIVNWLSQYDHPDYHDSTGKTQIYNHSVQHLSYCELDMLGLINNDYKIFSIVRHPYDRVISEFFYCKKYRPDIADKFQNNFKIFLDIFLNKNNLELFDFHNLSQYEFLVNKKGYIDPRVTIFKFFDISSIESYIGRRGLEYIHFLKTDSKKQNILLDEQDKKRIQKYFIKDFLFFHYDY